MPTPPQHYLNSSPSPANKADSVMDRRKPKLRSGGDLEDAEPIRISLGQPWMSTALATSGSPKGPRDLDKGPVARARTNADPSSRPDSILSINKSLPAPPPETEAESARDRVAFLNAQLQGLGNRRINITKSIKQMTELMPQDNLMASADVIHKRELEKRKVEALKQELAEVQREEYEIGLKLHRAYKRMDRDADYEPTTLWVRRVTG
ncbi:hypothetical protein UCRPA7_3584 [Phaeoacremonium minimum UCRPA7]|uniref:Uncharacterized protein n=1 Tax=Phaeoacremonium minimum (strain UCR-PA7) TaxID=1286976 RepID=R8BNU6_PHAM7|nr:hypothetical protein UCRPA7_3584 [Phaeoacremonium minimum UCRPA7]EOO00955.1 hypothetical protein UCRPA7_3584 [Phaeoacremonium minimum UCRPA7]